MHLLQHGGTNAAGPRRAGSSTTRRPATVHGAATVPSRHAGRRVDPPGGAGSVTAGCSTGGRLEQSPFINAAVDTTLAPGYCDVHTLMRAGVDVGSVRWEP